MPLNLFKYRLKDDVPLSPFQCIQLWRKEYLEAPSWLAHVEDRADVAEGGIRTGNLVSTVQSILSQIKPLSSNFMS